MMGTYQVFYVAGRVAQKVTVEAEKKSYKAVMTKATVPALTRLRVDSWV